MRLKHVKSWFESERRFIKTPVGVFLLGAFLGELAPDPTDAIHFWLQQHLLNSQKLPASTLAFLQVFDWYFLSASYFLFLLILAYILHVRKVATIRRITIVGGILGVGVVVGLLAQFIIGF
jgi:hypothetical protein